LRFNSFKAKPGFTDAVVACNGAACVGGVIPQPRQVTLTAYVCPDAAATCTPEEGALRVEAKVEIPLHDSLPPKITSWHAT
jgi:hypothetical protein